MSEPRTAAMKIKPSNSVALSLIFTPEPEEKGYTVTCKELPELITYGETLDEALKNAEDAFTAVCEAYDELGRDLPESIKRYHDVEPENGFQELIRAVVPMKIRQELSTAATRT